MVPVNVQDERQVIYTYYRVSHCGFSYLGEYR
jgi:hypothetical protein